MLLEHLLKRTEFEYAEHLLGHSDTPGEWCIECMCFCAGARDDGNSESEELDITNPHWTSTASSTSAPAGRPDRAVTQTPTDLDDPADA